MPGDFFAGVGYMLRGFGLIARPGLRRFFLIPAIVNVVVFVGLSWAGARWFDSLLNLLLPSGDAWWIELLRALLWTLFAGALLVVMYFAFTLVANLLGSPFNGILAERVERLIAPGEPTAIQAAGTLISVISALGNELHKFAYFSGFMAMGLIVMVIPFVNLAAPLVWAVIASWMLTLEYVAYPMENHGLAFKEVRARLRERAMLSFGFGAAVMVATLIPVINLMVMPAAVAGATAMWVEHLRLSAR